MIRRLRWLLLICLACVMAAPTALADFDDRPTRNTFSQGYSRLETAIRRSRAVDWRVSVKPVQLEGEEGEEGASTQPPLASMLSELALSGTAQALEEGGYFEAAMHLNGREIGHVGQAIMDGRTGLCFEDAWITVEHGMEPEATALLGLDTLGAYLLQMRYDSLLACETPFLSAIHRQLMRLWAQGSPYATDNLYRSVPSGPTSHATDYTIDTYDLRSLLNNWIDGLSMDGLSVGVPGTPLYLGVDETAYARFIEKARAFAASVELAKPLKFAMAYGEGDVLRTAKGSGTLQESERRTGISYNYRSDLADRKVTRKYSVDFQPREGGDTLVLSCTWVTSTNGKSAGYEEVKLTASGIYDGEPYEIEVHSRMDNEYTLEVENGNRLAETIVGTLSAKVVYAGRTVADIAVERAGTTVSRPSLSAQILIEDTYTVNIVSDERSVFAGVITMDLEVEPGAPEQPTVLANATRLEDYDLMAVENIRAAIQASYAGTQERLLQLLPVGIFGKGQ